MTDALSSRFDQLTPRQVECLRLTYERKTSKEIAVLLGISGGTVDGYIAEAVRVLRARNRRDAAERLHRHLAETAPQPLGGENLWVSPADHTLASDAPSGVPSWASLLPFRYKDAPNNDLPVFARIAWIPILAFLVAVGFGSLASGLRVINDLVHR